MAVKKTTTIEPPVPEVPPFPIGEENADLITEKKKTRTYNLTLNVKKTATSYHKIIHLDDNTDLDLILKLVKQKIMQSSPRLQHEKMNN